MQTIDWVLVVVPIAIVFGIAVYTLDAKIAWQKKQPEQAEKLLRQAVELQDQLHYIEPPDWLLSSLLAFVMA